MIKKVIIASLILIEVCFAVRVSKAKSFSSAEDSGNYREDQWNDMVEFFGGADG